MDIKDLYMTVCAWGFSVFTVISRAVGRSAPGVDLEDCSFLCLHRIDLLAFRSGMSMYGLSRFDQALGKQAVVTQTHLRKAVY